MFSITKLQSFIFLSVFIFIIGLLFVPQSQTQPDTFSLVSTAAAFGGGPGGGSGGGGDGGGGGCGGCGGGTGGGPGGGGGIITSYGSFAYGCTDDSATNYDPQADINDGSCTFPPVEGCTDIYATNYDFFAEKDDGSCEYPEVEVTSCDLTASAEIIETGGSVTLTWETEGYDNFTLNGQSVSDPNDSKTFTNILDTTTYTFVATNSNGDRCEAKVTVQCIPPVVPTCESFNITQSNVAPEADLTFNWNTSNATDVSINNDIGAVAVDGTNEIFTAPATDGTYTYTLTFDGKTNNSCVDTVTVKTPVVLVPACDAFGAEPAVITVGESSLLSWETTNATRVTINTLSEVAADDSASVSPLTTTTYLLTAFGANNAKDKCEVKVTVKPKVETECKLTIDKVVDKHTANVGDDVTYTIKVKNTGTADCTGGGVKIYDVVDPNLTYKNYTLTSNLTAGYEGKPVYTNSDRTLRFNGNVLTPNESGTITWTGTVKNPTQCGDFVVNNQAKTTAKEYNNFGTWVYSQIVSTDIDNDCVVLHPRCDVFTIAESTVAPEADLTFNWSTTNVSSVSFNNDIGEVAVDGINEIFTAPAAAGTYTYTLTFDGKTNNSCVDTVKVEEPVVDAPVCVAFTADPDPIVSGEQTTLTWEVENAVTLGLNNGIGDVTGATSFGPISPIASTVYVLDVFGADGTKVQCEAPVTVIDPTEPAISIVKRDAADADDTQTVAIGGTAAFEIIVTNIGSEDLVNVEVTDTREPACNETIGNLAVDASYTYTCNSTNVRSAFINVADITGDSAVDGATVTDSDPTTVEVENTSVLTCADISISASDTSVREGSDVTLEWVSTGNVSSVSIDNGIGSVALTGDREVRVNDTTTYNFTINGFDDSQSCPITISATTGGGGGGGGSSSPRCELEISDTRINRGEDITLTWDSSRARELILTDDRGNTIVTTEDRLSNDKEELFEGEITLTPTRDTEYTLRVERGSRDRECTVDVEMDDEVMLMETRDQAPLVTGISLTEVPYTGFEAGTVMTFLFYALLIAWALYITYVLVIPKTLLSAAPVLVTPRNTADHMTSAETVRPDAFAALPTQSVATPTAPKAAAPANLPIGPVEPVAVAKEAVVEVTATVATEIENQAHMYQALLSSSAVQSLIAMTTDADRSETLKKVISDAKGAYPLEDGWVVINQTRLTELTAQPAAAPETAALTGSGSLAEAVVTGNVVAAYDLIGARPMFALADASADLDALYRNRKGANEPVSDLLNEATKEMTDEQIADMIAALTGAIDGTYTDEASAVKMAIMKAIKIAS